MGKEVRTMRELSSEHGLSIADVGDIGHYHQS